MKRLSFLEALTAIIISLLLGGSWIMESVIRTNSAETIAREETRRMELQLEARMALLDGVLRGQANAWEARDTEPERPTSRLKL